MGCGLCQGLHDVLAVIVWVVHCDKVAWYNADESARCLGFVSVTVVDKLLLYC